VTDPALLRGLLTDMIRIRRMEEKCAELYSAGKIRGFLHLYVGEEAVAAGSLRALGADDDAVVATYREHAHALLRGVPMTRIMAEMFGKQEGCSGGRGGSMHLFDAGRRFYGGNAIVAAGLPVAAGLAFADVQLRRNRVTACYFGEGAVAEGAFHESMNMARLWQLPVLFWFLGSLGILSAAFLRRNRKYALLVVVVVAAVLTPPDIFSQVLMTLPLMLLYELGIFMVYLSTRTRVKAAVANELKESHSVEKDPAECDVTGSEG